MKMKASLIAFSSCAFFALSGCGGGGNDAGNSSLFPTNITVSAGTSQSLPAGQAFSLTGIARSENTNIVSMNWQMGKNASGTDYSGQATIDNGNCSIMGASQDGNYKSVRSCTANILLPAAALGQTYTMILTATDDKGNANSGTTTISVAASNASLSVMAGNPITATYGQVITPQCIASGGYLYNGSSPLFTFEWVDAKNQAIVLSPAVTTYVATRDGPMTNAVGTTSFTVPVNQNQADMKLLLQCGVIDSRGTQVKATQTVNLLASPPVQANAGAVQVVRPNSIVILQGSAIDPLQDVYGEGQAPTMYFYWVQRKSTKGTPVTLELTSPTSPNPTFVAPNIVTTDGMRNVYTFDMYADRKPIDVNNLDVYENSPSHAETRVLVDNYAPLQLTVDSPKKAVASETVNMTASVANAPSGLPLYYRWKQLTGESVSISNPNQAVASFIVPSSLVKPAVMSFEVIAMLQPVTDETASLAAPTEKSVYYVYLNNFAPLTISVTSPQTVMAGANATLGVTASATGYPLYYRWTQTLGIPVVITNGNTPNASFTAPSVVDSTLSFRVDVSSEPFVGTGMPNAPVSSAMIDFTVK